MLIAACAMINKVLWCGVGVRREDVADALPVDEVVRHMNGKLIGLDIPDFLFWSTNKKKQ